MLIYLVIAALVAAAALLTVPLLRRSSRLDEVDRFHVARSLTTSWSTSPQPDVRIPAEGESFTE